ncbi:hypothetical protein NADFUDRAFT_50265 [Nadsonia fulvescens var. elongata DSM 6958]|uniref:Cyclin N-terminal domain-containing protein n=1 Tax=Nadsonia fulvescens var. elongata DSM 6958 TaxID=857566 RepID=A0A1E3PLY8_9ASCO|nr:hypothetical protein NADFUDRAFT_50265 [Nadsonia fulvescens var. elongata DSM 6958]
MSTYTPTPTRSDFGLPSSEFNTSPPSWQDPNSPWIANEDLNIDIFPISHNPTMMPPSDPSYSHSLIQHGQLLQQLQRQIQQERTSYSTNSPSTSPLLSPSFSESNIPSLSSRGISTATSTTSFSTHGTVFSPLSSIDGNEFFHEDFDSELAFDLDLLNNNRAILNQRPSVPSNTLKSSINNSHPQETQKLSGTAAYLSFLFPSTLPRVSTEAIEQILYSLKLPLNYIALAGCLIDALSNQFFRTWLNNFPLTFNSIHIHPETIVLTTLIIATKFLDDYPGSARISTENNQRLLNRILEPNCCEDGDFTITAENLNKLEGWILQDLDYNILALLENDGVEFMKCQFRSCGPVTEYE